MSKIRIIPKLDIKGPNVIKGINLEGLRALGSPNKFSQLYYEQGADELILHDVVASLYGRKNLIEVIKNTTKNIFIPVVVGGGISSLKNIEELLRSGADRVMLNSICFRKPKILKDAINFFGGSTIVLSIEAAFFKDDFYCSYDYGRELTEIKVKDWIEDCQELGIGEFIITSVRREGTRKGFDFELAKLVNKVCKIPFIFNGGYSNINNMRSLLKICKPTGLAISSCLHYSRLETNKFEKNEIEGNFNFVNNKNFSYKYDKTTINLLKKNI